MKKRPGRGLTSVPDRISSSVVHLQATAKPAIDLTQKNAAVAGDTPSLVMLPQSRRSQSEGSCVRRWGELIPLTQRLIDNRLHRAACRPREQDNDPGRSGCAEFVPIQFGRAFRQLHCHAAMAHLDLDQISVRGTALSSLVLG